MAPAILCRGRASALVADRQYEPSDSEGDSDSDDSDSDEEVSEGEGSDRGDDDDRSDADSDAGAGTNGHAGPSRKRAGRSSKSPTSKRKRLASPHLPGQPKRLTRNARDAHYDRIDRYYASGTSWGMSVAQSIYLLATVLERADNDLLWLAILGATHQYVAGRIDRDTYEGYHELFLDEVVRLNVSPIPSTNRNGNGNGVTSSLGNGKTPNPDDRSITRTDELRFMLFRHWTLYDAMLHSGYVAGRLGIWKEKGRKRLQGLLAKMGYVFSFLAAASQCHTHA